MTYDTLIYNGTEKSLADWGFSADSARGRKRNQAADEFTGTLVNVTINGESASPTFPFEAQVTVYSGRTLSNSTYSGGTIKFQGKRIGQPMKASSTGQGVTYKFQGPWYDLEQTHYQQFYAGGAGNAQILVAETVLNSYAQAYMSNGVQAYWGNISTGDQLQFILEWLLQQYNAQGMAAPYQLAGRSQHFTGGTAGWSYTDGTAVIPTATASVNGGFMTWPTQSSPSISTSLYSLYLPSYITKPLKCSDAIHKCLELSPRANVWFDHTTQPPTAHVTMPENQTAKTLNLFDGTSHKSISINRRDDLIVRAVYLTYRITETINGSSLLDYLIDYWSAGGGWNNKTGTPPVPSPHSGLRVVSELIDLQGGSTTVVSGWMDCEPLTCGAGYTHTNKRTWWASARGGEHSKFADWRIRFQDKTAPVPVFTPLGNARIFYSESGVSTDGYNVNTGDEFTAGDYAFYTNRIVRGSYAQWMTMGGTQVLSVKAVVKVPAIYAEYDIVGGSDTDTTGNRKHITNETGEELHVNVELTNATNPGGGGVFTASAISTATAGENYILGAGGIAQYLYQHMSVVQYDGEAVHVAAEFANAADTNYVDLGCCLNLAMPAGVTPNPWAGMNAQIQEIEEDYGKHYTTVKIGVAKHLNAGQLSSLMNAWRNRRPWYNPACRGSSATTSGGTVQLSSANSQSDAVVGASNVGAVQNIDYTTPPSAPGGGLAPTVAGVMGGTLNHDPQLITTQLQAASSTPTVAGSTPTPVSPAGVADIKTMQPREMQVCDPTTGAIAYIILHCTAPYTKP